MFVMICYARCLGTNLKNDTTKGNFESERFISMFFDKINALMRKRDMIWIFWIQKGTLIC